MRIVCPAGVLNQPTLLFKPISPTILFSFRRLKIQNARVSDSGNYSCVPTSAESSSVMVHVINGEFIYFFSYFIDALHFMGIYNPPIKSTEKRNAPVSIEKKTNYVKKQLSRTDHRVIRLLWLKSFSSALYLFIFLSRLRLLNLCGRGKNENNLYAISIQKPMTIEASKKKHCNP
jgi:hypothetical protein